MVVVARSFMALPSSSRTFSATGSKFIICLIFYFISLNFEF